MNSQQHVLNLFSVTDIAFQSSNSSVGWPTGPSINNKKKKNKETKQEHDEQNDNCDNRNEETE